MEWSRQLEKALVVIGGWMVQTAEQKYLNEVHDECCAFAHDATMLLSKAGPLMAATLPPEEPMTIFQPNMQDFEMMTRFFELRESAVHLLADDNDKESSDGDGGASRTARMLPRDSCPPISAMS